ncbi:hypothetical protein WJX82_002333 [Trebouxia sp. C0006]
MQSETEEQRVSIRCSPQEVGCSDERRFLLELEFVQCLSSPQYLNWLSQNRFFDDASFINYLAYLKYWKQPEYARFIIYPHSLFFLDCLQSQDFRTAMARNEIKVRSMYCPKCLAVLDAGANDAGDGAQPATILLAAPPQQQNQYYSRSTRGH